MNNIIDEIINQLNNCKRIAILPHTESDGDCLGSSLAFMLAIKQIGKDAKILVEEAIPKSYSSLPYANDIQIYQGETDKYDLIVALDVGDLDRLGKRLRVFKNVPNTINIDHHITNTKYAKLNLIDEKASSVGEVLYELLFKMMRLKIDKSIAECLYVSIATDTGGFRYSNTSAITHMIVSNLLETNIDVADISNRIFNTTTHKKLKITACSIENLELYESGKLAVIAIVDSVFKELDAKDEDSEGIVNIGRSIEGVEVSMLLKERENNLIKVSLRSKNYFDCASFSSIFSGGGHIRAAGFVINGEINVIKKMLIVKIKEYL